MFLAFVIFSVSVLLITYVASYLWFMIIFCVIVTILLLLRYCRYISSTAVRLYMFLFVLPLISFFIHRAWDIRDWYSVDASIRVTTWTILSVYRPWMYMYQTNYWKWLIAFTWEVTPWDTIIAHGNMKLAYAPHFHGKNEDEQFSWYSKWLYVKWYTHVFYARHMLVTWQEQLSPLYTMRHSFLQEIKQMYWQSSEAWLLAWMYIWDISTIDPYIYDTFISSGLVHIVAVSWSNIYMLICFLHVFLFFLPYYIRVWCIMVCITRYAYVCGADSSVLRALVMWLITFVSVVTWFPVRTSRVCLYAYIFLLCVQPYALLYDLWFWLSFLALGWILLLDAYGRKKLGAARVRYKKLFYWYVLPSLWATWWVLPLLLYSMWSVNLTSVIWNVFVVPFIPVVLVWGALSFIWMTTWLWLYVSHGVLSILSYMIYIADISSWLNSTLSIDKPWVFLIFISTWLVITYVLWTATLTSTSDNK